MTTVLPYVGASYCTAAPPRMSRLVPLIAELWVVLLVFVVLSLVCPRRWSLGLSLLAVAFVEAAFVLVVSPRWSLSCWLHLVSGLLWRPKRL